MRTACFFAISIFMSSVSMGQIADDRVASLELEVSDLKSEIDQLKTLNQQILDRLNQLAPTPEPQPIDPLVDLAEQPAADSTDSTGACCQRLTRAVIQLRKELKSLNQSVLNNGQDLETTRRDLTNLATNLGNVGRTDSQGRFGLDILGNVVESKQVRRDLYHTTVGVFEIHNQTGKDEPMRINGDLWTLPRNHVSKIRVPFGPVYTKLVNGDSFDFDFDAWKFENNQHVLRARITDVYPQPVP